MSKINRRNFVRNASLGAAAMGLSGFSQEDKKVEKEKTYRNPREVSIASFTLNGIIGKDLNQVIQSALTQLEIAAPMSPDICCLPEVFHVARIEGGRPPLEESSENGSGNIIGPFQSFAKKNKCYLVCPIYTVENGKYYNAAVIIDREGKYLGEYRKVRLTQGELGKGMTPGPMDVPVFKLDFGLIGVQICFDMEYPEGWDQLRRKGAEIVFWPSAFSGGIRVDAKALDNRYCVVSSTWSDPTKICDVEGELAVSGGQYNTWGVFASLNLERAILHTNSAGTVGVKYNEIRKKYGNKLRLKLMGPESYTILESLSPDLKVADVMKEFDLRTYSRHLEIPNEMKAEKGFEH